MFSCKKILPKFICLLVAVALFAVAAPFARATVVFDDLLEAKKTPTEFTVTADKLVAHPGDEVTVTVAITGGERNITSYIYYPIWSNAAYEVIRGEVIGIGLEADKGAVFQVGSGAIAVFSNADVRTGDLFRYTLRIKDDAVFGTYDLVGSVSSKRDATVWDCDLIAATITVEEAPPHEHTFTNYVSNNDATCTKDGTETAKCEGCEETHTRTAADSKLDHSFVKYVSNNDATCTEDGTETAKCEGCEETHTRTAADSKLDHSFVNYVSNNDATCTEDGTETAKCEGCEETHTRIVADSKLDHEYKRTVTQPTCEDIGFVLYDCIRCDEGDYIGPEYPPLGHSFTNYVSNDDATWEKDGTKTAVCDREGCDATDTIPDEGSKLPHGWVQHGDEWLYFNKGVMVTGWLEYGPVWYYFSSGGVMYESQWLYYGGHHYYFNSIGRMVVNNWAKDGGEWYYFDANGYRVTGEYTINDEVNIFDENGVWKGVKVEEGWSQENGKWYYYENGTKKTGWLDQDGTWYYFNPKGEMTIGWLAYGPVWYYFNPDGDMRLGWLTYGGKTYYFDKAATNYGRMSVSKWIQDSGKWYYFDQNGYMVTGVYTINGEANMFDDSGKWMGLVLDLNGWVQQGGGWYYYKDGVKQTGWLILGDYWYLLDTTTGVMWHDRWANGGNGGYYYFSSEGYIYKNGTYMIDGKACIFNERGLCFDPPEGVY